MASELPSTYKMQDIPDEIISELIDHLDFGAVLPFALTCRRYACLVAKSAMQIADKYTDYDEVHQCRKSLFGQAVRIYGSRLPNRVNHGRVEFREDNRAIFRVTYMLGKPTYWRTVGFESCVWGCVSVPYYVCSWDDDDFSVAEVCVKLDNGFTIGCNKHGHSIVYDNKMRPSSHRVPDMMPPSSFIVDGNIHLTKIKKWGGMVSHHARTIWPGVKTIERKIDVFDGELDILRAIFQHCPGMHVMFERV